MQSDCLPYTRLGVWPGYKLDMFVNRPAIQHLSKLDMFVNRPVVLAPET